jgi:hypothetical protein
LADGERGAGSLVGPAVIVAYPESGRGSALGVTGPRLNNSNFSLCAERSLGQLEELAHVWDRAAHVDQVLVDWSHCKTELAQKYIGPIAFSKQALFTSLICDQPIIVSDLCIAIDGHETDRRGPLLEGIRSSIPPTERIKVRAGQAETTAYLSPQDLVARWERGRARFCVTDFHFRETPLEQSIDLKPLSEFNLLAAADSSIADEEVMTLVMSSRDAFTDSHSDDLDVSNHCVTGLKLWLVWETQQGRHAGLQDVERDIVYERAAFDLSTFCKLDSARWLTVGPGETLFLPGRFTHRVITLDRYLGFGSFFFSLPNLLQTASRWTNLPPLWTLQKGNDHLVGKILAAAFNQLRSLLTANSVTKDAWGLQYVPIGVDRWLNMTSMDDRHRVQEYPGVREIVRLAEQIRDQFGKAP